MLSRAVVLIPRSRSLTVRCDSRPVGQFFLRQPRLKTQLPLRPNPGADLPPPGPPPLTPGHRKCGRSGRTALAGHGLLDALSGGGGPDGLVDGQRLLQAGGAFAGVAVLEIAAADTLQGSCFLQRRAEFACDGQRRS